MRCLKFMVFREFVPLDHFFGKGGYLEMGILGKGVGFFRKVHVFEIVEISDLLVVPESPPECG